MKKKKVSTSTLIEVVTCIGCGMSTHSTKKFLKPYYMCLTRGARRILNKSFTLFTRYIMILYPFEGKFQSRSFSKCL